MKKKPLTKESKSSSIFKTQPQESRLFYENELFRGLQPAELKLLFNKMQVRVYNAGNIIFMPEDPSCERLYQLTQGQVEMYRLTPNGKRLVTRHILPGGVFGVRGLFDRKMQKNFAEALENSTIGIITREQVLGHLKLQPGLMLRILENVCSRLYLLEDRLVETVYNPTNIRLAYFLLTNADTTTNILSDFTHEEIGNQIGSVRQTVTEELGILRKEGLIKTTPGQIQIVDRNRLEEMIRNKDR